MNKIVSIEDFRKQIQEERPETFDQLLRKANLLKKKATDRKDIKSFEDLKEAFEIQLNTFLLESHLIGADIFLCASYIASILSYFGGNIPESWYAIDYLLKDQGDDSRGKFLKEGADVCFILCSLHPQRCERRAMKKSDYVSMGSGMYYKYYRRTCEEVAYHMANNFELMSEVTAECVHKI